MPIIYPVQLNTAAIALFVSFRIFVKDRVTPRGLNLSKPNSSAGGVPITQPSHMPPLAWRI